MRLVLLTIAATLCIAISPPVLALTPSEVLVVYNDQELPDPSSQDYALACQIIPASQAVATYYAATRGIPACNLLGLPAAPFTEYAYQSQYLATIATPISTYLSSHANIRCIVLCYGVPSRVSAAGYEYSVDSALTLLGNTGIPANTPWGYGTANPYLGKSVDFGTFRDSADNHITGPNSESWKLNYLVTRLDGFSEPTENVTVQMGSQTTTVAIPRDVKAMVDRSVHAQPGGKFVIDRSDAESLKNQLVAAGITQTDIVWDQTDDFLTDQQDVIGYFGEHMSDGHANNHTTWCRPWDSWHQPGGGVALANTNDGQSFRKPQLFWGPLTEHGAAVANTLTVTDMHHSATTPDQYAGHQVVLCSGIDNTTLASGTFSMGTCSIDLTNVAWPTDQNDHHPTYFEIRFAQNDAQHPGAYIPDSRTPSVGSDYIWSMRNSGVTYSCGYDNPSNRIARTLSAEYICEGASGAISFVMEPSGSRHRPDYVFPRYYKGYTWAESAYMGIDNLSWQQTVLGDPLMAPFAASPTVSISVPSSDPSSATGTVNIAASATPVGSASISRMEIWVSSGFRSGGTGTNVNELISLSSSSSISYSFDTTAQQGGNPKYPDGAYTLQVIAYDDTAQRACGSAVRHIYIDNNAGTPQTQVTLGGTIGNGDYIYDNRTMQATATNQSVVSSMEFWMLGSKSSTLLGTTSTGVNSVYELEFDSRRFPDGNYSIQALAICTGGKIVPSDAKSMVVRNMPSATIGTPENDLEIKSSSFQVEAAPVAGDASVVSGMKFYISPLGTALQLLGSDTSSPYTYTVDPSDYSDGTYTLRAVPLKSSGAEFPSRAERRVVLANGHTVKSSIAAARLEPDTTPVALENLAVSAPVLSSMDSAFYAASPSRVAGIRVTSSTNASFTPGTLISIIGEMDTSSEGEREIAADLVFPAGTSSPPQPLFMPIRSLGGSSPDQYTNGIDDGQGLYNIGQLVRVCGHVSYIGSDFVYIEDGSGGTDGSGVQYRPVPLDGGTIPSGVDATGVRVYFGSLTKPKIGDYVAINGISSLKLINDQYARYVRATELVTGYVTYQPSYLWWGAYGLLFSPNSSPGNANQPGDRVRVATEDVYANNGDYFEAWMPFANGGGMGAPAFDAVTALTTSYSDLIVVGTVVCNDGASPEINVGAIYQGTVGSPGVGVLSVGGVGTARGTYKPYPGPTAEEILSSPAFRQADCQPGCIGWALAQPDGSVVDLTGEMIVSMSNHGLTFGLKEMFEPMPREPRLALRLDAAVDANGWYLAGVDIKGATLTTLADGRRVLARPQAVDLYITAHGSYIMPMPSAKSDTELWPWKERIVPQDHRAD